MATDKGYKDRKKLNLKVKREFQKWMFLRVLLVVILSALVAGCILYFYARTEVVGSYFDAHVKIRRVSDLLFPVVAAGSAVSLFAGGLLALFLPQKIAGPIYRIEQGLKAAAEGDLTASFRLRDEDTLQDFAGTVAQTMQSLSASLQHIKVKVDAMEAALNEGRTDEAQNIAADLKKNLDQLKTARNHQ